MTQDSDTNKGTSSYAYLRHREEQEEQNLLAQGILQLANRHPDPTQRAMFPSGFWSRKGVFFLGGLTLRWPTMHHPPTTMARLQSAVLVTLTAIARSTATPEAGILNLRILPRWVVNARVEVWGEIKQPSTTDKLIDSKPRDRKWVLAYRKHLLHLADEEASREVRWSHSRATRHELFDTLSLGSHQQLQRQGFVTPQLWDHEKSLPITWADIANPRAVQSGLDPGGEPGLSETVDWVVNKDLLTKALKKPS